MNKIATLSVMVSLAALAGCSQNMENRRFQTRIIHGATPDDVYQAALVILRREFGKLIIDAPARQIVSAPAEYRTSSGSGTARDFYGGGSTMRNTAHFSVGRKGDGAVARLRVDIERKDTARQEAFQLEHHRVSDAPGQTPIERDAATSTKQNTVWTFVKRDRRLERGLLMELQEQFAPTPEKREDTQSADAQAEKEQAR